MKTKLLFPNRFKIIGWILLIPSTILGILIIYYDFKFEILETRVFSIYSNNVIFDQHPNPVFFGLVKGNYTNTIVGVLFLAGAMLVAFSKEKIEDEFISKTRLESLVWAIFVNYAILIFCFLFFFELQFLSIMVYNMFTILIFFIIRFNYVLYK